MQTATSSVEFSFNHTMYRQTDGVVMRSPLDLAVANIFVGYQETKLFLLFTKKPLIYYRYVDDTFAVFEMKMIVKNFFLYKTFFLFKVKIAACLKSLSFQQIFSPKEKKALHCFTFVSFFI